MPSRRVVALFVSLLVCSFALAQLAPAEPLWRLRVDTADAGAVAGELARAGFDVAFVDREAGIIEVVGGAAVREALEARGLAPEVVEDLTPTTESTEALSDYLSPAEIETRLEQYESAYPDLALRQVYATSQEGRSAWALKISDNVDLDEDEPAILFVAQHHAREVMTPEVAMDLIDQLLTGYGQDPEVTGWVDDYEIWVLPSHNPDGADYVFTGSSMWRKNRRDNGDGTFGVDPNRNYPFQWGGTVCDGSSGSTGSDTYRGPSPASEPITQGIMDLSRAERPVYNVSYHTYGEYVLHPLGCAGQYPGEPDYRAFRELTSEVSAVSESDVNGRWYRFGTGAELLYSTDGEMNDWFYAEIGSFGVTFELNASSQGFQPDYDTWRDSTVLRSREGWRYFLRRMGGPHVSGHVRDACSGDPLEATVRLAELTLPNGESERTSSPVHGRIDWPVQPGSYTLEVSLDGYRSQTWPVTVDFSPTGPDVGLVPEGLHDLAVRGLRLVDEEGDDDGRADPGETVDLLFELYATGEAVTGAAVRVFVDDPYVTVQDDESTLGALAAGEFREAPASDPITLRIAPDAPEGHEIALELQLVADESLCHPDAARTLTVTKGVRSCPAVSEPLDDDPGWEIDNGGAADGWEFGPPAGGGGPTVAYTGDNVYGTNLDGSYGPGGTFLLTAGPYDIGTLATPELRFARWLDTQVGRDIARLEVRSGASGNWNEVWRGFGRDEEWVPLRYDLSDLADNSRELYVRFVLETDGSGGEPGFYVDDLQICGEERPGPGGQVKYHAHVVDDADPVYGNGNGRWDVGETVTLEVEVLDTSDADAFDVTGILTTETPGVIIQNARASWPDIASGATAFSLAPHFTVTAEADCGTTAEFLLTVRWNDGQRSESRFTVPIGVLVEESRLADDFEENSGWTVGGSPSAGQFVREDPHGVDDAGAGAVQPEDDRTDFPGQLCYVTGNPQPGPGFDAADGDLDRGTASLDSPAFDGTGDGQLLLRFARWFHRSSVGFLNEATYRARVSSDGGATWTTVESLDVNAAAWVDVELDLGLYTDRTSDMRLRFEATEVVRSPGDPLVELLVDDVHVLRRYEECEPFTPAADHPPNPVGNTVLVEHAAGDIRLAWTAPPVDPDHDAAAFYPVYVSSRPDADFATEGEPTAPRWYDTDGAGPTAGSRFYLVAARNAAGTSGEEPVP